MELCQVLPKIWSYVEFYQKYGIMLSFAKNMEFCQVLPKICNYFYMSIFAKNIELRLSFAKFMEFCQVLPKLRTFIYFVPNL